MAHMKRNEHRHYSCHRCRVTVYLTRSGGDVPTYHAEVLEGGKRVIMLTHTGYFTGMQYKIHEWHVCDGALVQTVGP